LGGCVSCISTADVEFFDHTRRSLGGLTGGFTNFIEEFVILHRKLNVKLGCIAP
jgi:hypothetical protein